MTGCSSEAGRAPAPPGTTAWATLALLAIASCGGQARPAGATTALEAPGDGARREAAALALGRALHGALASDGVEALVMDDLALRQVLQPEPAGRAAVLRHNLGQELTLSPQGQQLWRQTRYRGVCLQDVRHEPAGGAAGLQEPGWVVGRTLVVADFAGGGRLAAWVDGTFVYTDRGFAVALVERVEAPRRDHADLQLATCDLRAGLD